MIDQGEFEMTPWIDDNDVFIDFSVVTIIIIIIISPCCLPRVATYARKPLSYTLGIYIYI